MEGKCAKQTTISIIECLNGKYYIGTNWCYNAQEECPRKDLPTGVGYEMCNEICDQNAHAEADACWQAEDEARGGTLYLLGHTYCCDNCKKIIESVGIAKVVIGDIPESFKSKIVSTRTCEHSGCKKIIYKDETYCELHAAERHCYCCREMRGDRDDHKCIDCQHNWYMRNFWFDDVKESVPNPNYNVETKT